MRKGIRPWIVVAAAWAMVAALSIANRAVQFRVAGRAVPRLRDLVFDNGQGLLFALMTAPIFAASRRWPFSGARAGRRAALHFGLAALEARVNPHFLFNTLNTIAVFVREGDRQGAVRMVEHLSELLRRTLERRGSGEVRLEEELDLARQYLAIEEARFPDRLRVAWE